MSPVWLPSWGEMAAWCGLAAAVVLILTALAFVLLGATGRKR